MSSLGWLASSGGRGQARKQCAPAAAALQGGSEPIVPDAVWCANGGFYGFQCACSVLVRQVVDLHMKASRKAERTLFQRLSRFIRLFPNGCHIFTADAATYQSIENRPHLRQTRFS